MEDKKDKLIAELLRSNSELRSIIAKLEEEMIYLKRRLDLDNLVRSKCADMIAHFYNQLEEKEEVANYLSIAYEINPNHVTAYNLAWAYYNIRKL
jgi:hypothetical protein